jgi:hypothetical protein
MSGVAQSLWLRTAADLASYSYAPGRSPPIGYTYVGNNNPTPAQLNASVLVSGGSGILTPQKKNWGQPPFLSRQLWGWPARERMGFPRV